MQAFVMFFLYLNTQMYFRNDLITNFLSHKVDEFYLRKHIWDSDVNVSFGRLARANESYTFKYSAPQYVISEDEGLRSFRIFCSQRRPDIANTEAPRRFALLGGKCAATKLRGHSYYNSM